MADPKTKKPLKTSRAWESVDPGLSPWLLEAVASMGFKRMTPVQASTIPLAMGNKDVVVEAVTGSGKTLSYLIPVIEKILRLEEAPKKHHVAAIVISPTRELASQIFGVLKDLLEFHGPSRAALHAESESDAETENAAGSDTASLQKPGFAVVPQLLVGGDISPAENLRTFLKESPNLLIATPGRLLELLKSPHVHCPQSSFEILILDEADRLLDLGFKADLQNIIGKLPKQRRTGLFSASVSEAVDQIVRVGLRNPVKISVKVKSTTGREDQRTPASLAMTYVTVKPSARLPTIAKILANLQPTPTKTIVYLSTCAAVDYFQHLLGSALNTANGPSFAVIPLHGKHPPNVRQKNFAKFSGTITPSILLTTDVAARGLDIPQVDVVIQIDPPSDPKVFMHRCGRAGRAGRKGLSVVLLLPGREEEYVPYLEIRKTPIKKLDQVDYETSAEDSINTAERMRELVRQDRALHEKAQKAFVSWLQSYNKHQASSIFRLSNLDWADLGQAWALLKLPKMPEIKSWDGDRTLGVKVDWENYSYKDKQREAARLKAQQDARNGVVSPKETKPQTLNKNSAWSIHVDAKEDREKRREKRQAKRSRQKFESMTAEEKDKQAELERLISEVKRQKREEDDLEEFDGFDN